MVAFNAVAGTALLSVVWFLVWVLLSVYATTDSTDDHINAQRKSVPVFASVAAVLLVVVTALVAVHQFVVCEDGCEAWRHLLT